MNERQRQAVLLLGFMVLLAIVMIYLRVSADLYSFIPSVDVGQLPVFRQIAEGWSQITQDVQRFKNASYYG